MLYVYFKAIRGPFYKELKVIIFCLLQQNSNRLLNMDIAMCTTNSYLYPSKDLINMNLKKIAIHNKYSSEKLTAIMK